MPTTISAPAPVISTSNTTPSRTKSMRSVPQQRSLSRRMAVPQAKREPMPQIKPRLVVRPTDSLSEEVDITRKVVEIIAQELWKRYQGNDVLNWIQAERLFEDAMHRAAADLRPGGMRHRAHGRDDQTEHS
jgi:hypothetical protein